MTAYRNLDHLTTAIESVLDQDIGSIEFILVDDGSPENIPQIIAPYADKIRYIRHENRGPGAARDTGVQAARSEFIAFCDSDDLQLRHRLSGQAALLRKFPDAALVFGDLSTYEDGHVTVPSTLRARQLGLDTSDFDTAIARAFGQPSNCVNLGIDVPDELAQTPVYCSRVPALVATRHIAWDGASMFRKSNLLAVGGHDIDVSYMEDWQLVSKISKQFDLVFWDTPVLLYRQHSGQQTKQAIEVTIRAYRDVVVDVWKDDPNFIANYPDVHRELLTKAYLQNIHYAIEVNDYDRARSDIVDCIRAVPFQWQAYKQMFRCIVLELYSRFIRSRRPNSRDNPPKRGPLIGVTAALALVAATSVYFAKTLAPEIETYSDQAISIAAEPSEVSLPPRQAADRVMEPILVAWGEGRIQDAFEISQRIAANLDHMPSDSRHYVIEGLVAFSIGLGRIDDALVFATQLDDVDMRAEMFASISFASGEKDDLLGLLSSGSGFRNPTTALYMSMVGLNDQAVALEADLSVAEKPSSRRNVLSAMAAVHSGNSTKAKSLFQKAIHELSIDDEGYFFVAYDMLSRIHNTEGDIKKSIDVLENTMPQRDFAIRNGSAIFWLMCQRQLAALYRQSGRDNDADELENILRSRLILADDDFPLAVSLADA